MKAALAGDFSADYTGDVTLDDDDNVNIQATDITTIEGDTTGTVTVSNDINLQGTATAVAAAVADVNTFSGTPTAELSTAHDLAELVAINNKISGELTLADYDVDLEG